MAATRTPKLDDNLKQILPTDARTTDKELARIQTFVLDAVSPLVSLQEAETAGKTVTLDKMKAATTAALELVCNTSARISRLRSEKVCAHFKREVQPLAQRDELFTDAAPYLFRPEFAQKSKEQVEQMRAIQTVLPRAKMPFFFQAPPRIGGLQPGAEQSIQDPLLQGKLQGQEKSFSAQFSHGPPWSRKD